ncbi:ABC transporter ATP-binding protein [Paenibacillus sp. FSL R5-0744]|uniref:ABC transporter ATP-binding protein n=1 Tax=unclassified Paenibacillus TaxID=185978 RepID=UPI0030D9A617
MRTKSLTSTWTSIRYVLSTSWINSRRSIIYYSTVTLLLAVQPFLLILFPKFIIDELTGQQRPQHFIFLISLMFLILTITSYFTGYLQNLGLTQLMKVVFKQIHAHTAQNMNVDFKNTEDPGYLNQMEQAKRSLQSVQNGFQGFFHTFFSCLAGFLAFAGYITVIGGLNFAVIVFLIVSIGCSYVFSLRAKRYEYEHEQQLSELERKRKYYSDIMQDFTFGKEIRINSFNNTLVSLYHSSVQNRQKIQSSISSSYFQSEILDILIRLFREGIVYGYLAYLYLHQRITIGDFVMYTTAVAGFSGVLQGFMKDLAHLRTQNLYIEELRNFLEIPQDKQGEGGMHTLPTGPYSIEFKEVSFTYPGTSQPVFNKISFIIPPHQRLAIVGHNGAGKTTLIKLLCRLYEPDGGEITLNGINIKHFAKTDYWRLFSTVFQEIRVLAFSLAENISLKEHRESDALRIHDSLEKAGLSEKVASLKSGILTPMQKFLDDQGVEFSGGENQRMMLARALYKNGDLIILDEPTAAVDAIAEFNLYTRFNEMIGERTALYISHRLSSTRFCDQILYMEQGEIAEAGSHSELMKQNGRYNQMYQIQAQYYKGSES